MQKNPYKLILITNRGGTSLSDYLDFIRICAESGITAVQLREKNADKDFLLEFGCRLKEVLQPFQIPLIVNDSTNLAIRAKADGVHLGQADDDTHQARRILGEQAIIGWSVETNDQLKQAQSLPINYIAASAVFSTSSKQDTKTLWGIEGLTKFVQQSKHQIVAIGGINQFNIKKVMRTGIDGVAIIGAIHNANNPQKITQHLRQIIDETIGERR